MNDDDDAETIRARLAASATPPPPIHSKLPRGHAIVLDRSPQYGAPLPTVAAPPSSSSYHSMDTRTVTNYPQQRAAAEGQPYAAYDP
jgi:hypothetical protein